MPDSDSTAMTAGSQRLRDNTSSASSGNTNARRISCTSVQHAIMKRSVLKLPTSAIWLRTAPRSIGSSHVWLIQSFIPARWPVDTVAHNATAKARPTRYGM